MGSLQSRVSLHFHDTRIGHSFIQHAFLLPRDSRPSQSSRRQERDGVRGPSRQWRVHHRSLHVRCDGTRSGSGLLDRHGLVCVGFGNCSLGRRLELLLRLRSIDLRSDRQRKRIDGQLGSGESGGNHLHVLRDSGAICAVLARIQRASAASEHRGLHHAAESWESEPPRANAVAMDDDHEDQHLSAIPSHADQHSERRNRRSEHLLAVLQRRHDGNGVVLQSRGGRCPQRLDDQRVARLAPHDRLVPHGFERHAVLSGRHESSLSTVLSSYPHHGERQGRSHHLPQRQRAAPRQSPFHGRYILHRSDQPARVRDDLHHRRADRAGKCPAGREFLRGGDASLSPERKPEQFLSVGGVRGGRSARQRRGRWKHRAFPRRSQRLAVSVR